MASNPKVAPVAIKASVKSFMNVGSLELHTWTAPMARSRSTCSAFRTMFTS